MPRTMSPACMRLRKVHGHWHKLSIVYLRGHKGFVVVIKHSFGVIATKDSVRCGYSTSPSHDRKIQSANGVKQQE